MEQTTPNEKTHLQVTNEATRQHHLSDQVYDQLVDLISSGEYPDNTKLPGEFDLAKRLGVSRPILRQALARLRLEGSVYSRQGAGTFVLHQRRAGQLMYGDLQNLPDVQRCLEFRCALESEAAAQAAANRDPERLQDVSRAMRALDGAIATGESTIEADFAFHVEVARATRNRFFVITLDALHSQILFSINLIRSLSTRPLRERLQTVQAEHAAIFEAIKKGDREEAKRTMAEHLGHGVSRLFNQQT